MEAKTINVNELQAKISGILKEVQQDRVYEVIRYSEPVAVVLSYRRYLRLKGECKRCVEELKEIAHYARQGKGARKKIK